MRKHKFWVGMLGFGPKCRVTVECQHCGHEETFDEELSKGSPLFGGDNNFEQKCENCELTLLDVNGEEVEK